MRHLDSLSNVSIYGMEKKDRSQEGKEKGHIHKKSFYKMEGYCTLDYRRYFK